MIYTACIQDEDRIYFFGQGETPDKALSEFYSGPIDEHCDYYGIEPGTNLMIGVYETKFSDDWTEDEASDADSEGWQWILGLRVRVEGCVYKS